MASAKQDYYRFLRWLHEPQREVPDNVRRFANMILAEFDAVAATSRQRNARAAVLARLARERLANAPPGLPDIEAHAASEAWLWRRLKALTVGPFRGFRREERFDLRKRIVLFYGPNGSGKTSLCEALERALLGSVGDADLKRIEERRYLRNIHAGRFVEPGLTATDANGNEVPVAADADLYRFCFIEKNRIDAFARIAARPPAQRTELIAALFGMDKFNDFASHFNEQMDAELTLRGEKQTQLRLKREGLARDGQTVRDEAAVLAVHDAENATYAEGYAPGTTYAQLKAMVGTEAAPGRLHELNQVLNAVPAAIIGVTRETLLQAYNVINQAAEQCRKATQELERRSSQVSFKDLFTALTVLQATEGDHCPACDTPLDRVVRNPYEKARLGLGELRDLAELQARQKSQRESLDEASQALRGHLDHVYRYLEAQGRAASGVGQYISRLPRQPRGDGWWTGIYAADAGSRDDVPSLEQIAAAADEIAQRDTAARTQLQEREAFVKERDRLIECQRYIDARDGERARMVNVAAEARTRIAHFEEANAGLIAQADQEQKDIERDAPIKAAYDDFLRYLREFRDQLPSMLIAGLNDLAMELYNEFNHLDHEHDKLAALYLPLTGEQRIELAFRGAPQRREDALAVLSEGHIRCLGLAILLAKSLSMDCPVIIFDDAINAIDHDHRNGIRQTVFDGDRFLQSQLLVTCHSQEFIKDIQNSMPRERRADCQEYLLMYHDGDHHPRVHPDVGSSNYLARAQQALDRFDSRDALSYARKALEMLGKKSWKWLKSHDQGELTVLVDGPGNEPTLRALCESLRKKLRESPTFVHASKEPLLNAVEIILGIPSNLIWTYLNKGTHEEADREEFDREQVALVVQTLEQIDRLELRQGR
ncbi:recombination protein F [Burkholderia pseudomallei]|uniref:AAA family ATPase n=1 Tax=Burkholderia pseudomallei TaxID=28450 RepID=UPI0005E4EDF4|nr:ATP-binding protein [Burkholderia pseudomallei]CAK1342357.1 recombination protein F [Burkholderia pseudomallei]CAK1343137.1 recombination protein F [Burkholderia pseudomallei]